MTEQTQPARGIKLCSTCGADLFRYLPRLVVGGQEFQAEGGYYAHEYAGGTCSQGCAQTFAIVEVGRELLKLLRVMSFPTYSIADDRGLPTGQVGPRHSWPAAEPAPHPTDQEPSSPVPKPSWWDKADY